MFTKKTSAAPAAAPVASPAGAPLLSSASAAAKTSKNSLRGARRRLSVVSDNKLIEGLATLGLVENEDVTTRVAEKEVVWKKYAGVSKKGHASYNLKKRNQDSLLMDDDKGTGTLLVGVFDGHGEAGDLVSHYFADRIARRLLASPRYKDTKTAAKDLAAVMAEEIDQLEKTLLTDVSIDTEFSGTTAVMSALRGKQLITCNIGDSRCIIGRKDAGGKIKAAPVTDDHKPDRPDEQKRIIAKGGRVFAVEYEDGTDGPPRVWLGHMDIPGLAMARSLGDTVAHTAGVISEPEITVTDLTPNDKVIIWASDGLWEFVSNQEALDMISGIDDPKKAVDILVQEANTRWMREEQVIDDTTVVVAFLDVRS